MHGFILYNLNIVNAINCDSKQIIIRKSRVSYLLIDIVNEINYPQISSLNKNGLSN